MALEGSRKKSIDDINEDNVDDDTMMVIVVMRMMTVIIVIQVMMVIKIMLDDKNDYGVNDDYFNGGDFRDG